MNNIKTPTDEQILRYAEDLGVLKGYAVDNYTRWVYIHDVTGYDDYVTVDATSEVLALARYAASLAAPELVSLLPDGSACFTTSTPLPKDHWLYAEQSEFVEGQDTPILSESQKQAVILAGREAIRCATFNGQEMDFDPDALVQRLVYVLCGPSGQIIRSPELATIAPEARVWHSMETAPKDGRYILGHNKTVDGEDDYAVVFWFESVGHSGSWNTGTYNWEPEEWTPCDGISPVAVTEGLPEKKDCDPNGYFWVFVEDDKRWEWMNIGDMNWQYRDHHGYTHWAPWWAFPLPEVK
jgi:hypothetical protein